MKKAELRKSFLLRQRLLTAAERREKSRQAIQNLFADVDLGDKRFVSCFVTLEKNNEFDTSQIFKNLRREFPNSTVCVPRVNFAIDELENVEVSAATKFVQNKWQILEPVGGRLIEPAKLDAVLVPLVAFDERGFRVGYGKGFYDKFLSRCRADCFKVGLSLFPPGEEIENVANFDVPLDACVTPEKTFRFKQSL